MKWIDIPPVWLALFIGIAWLAPTAHYTIPGQAFVGQGLIIAGLVLMGLAFFEMRRHRTTVIPHQQASNLVSSGIFSVSRNPIYLGDAVVLVGFLLLWYTSLIFFLIVPLFIWLITFRFIRPEESMLNQSFGPEFAAYCKATRRWL